MFIPLMATACFSHRGRTVTVGQIINVTPIEAAAYTYQRLARFHTDSNAQTSEAPAPKRRYRRRDLTAEEA